MSNENGRAARKQKEPASRNTDAGPDGQSRRWAVLVVDAREEGRGEGGPSGCDDSSICGEVDDGTKACFASLSKLLRTLERGARQRERRRDLRGLHAPRDGVG